MEYAVILAKRRVMVWMALHVAAGSVLVVAQILLAESAVNPTFLVLMHLIRSRIHALPLLLLLLLHREGGMICSRGAVLVIV
jgi:hypothetical protein